MAKPKPTGFQWKRMPTPFHGKEYRVWGDVDGKRKQFWFATEKEAKAVCADRNQERDAYGSKVNLDSEARLEAFRAAQLLEGSGKSILDVVRLFLEDQKRISVSGPFSELAAKVRAEFKRRLQKNEVSDRHSESLNETLRKLEARFGDQVVSEIKTEEIQEWLTGLPLATKTRNKHRGYAGQVFNLAVDYGYLPANPVTKIKRFNERSTEEDEISFLSADETERLFRAADPAVIPFLTLSFFCGVRVATLERLSWADVKFEEGRVIVPRYKGKNQKRYPVTISENALEWLNPYVRKSGSLLVAATSINRSGAAFGSPSRTATRNLIKAAAHRAGVALPDNAGRHTFISMHVAAYESLDKTATESDKSPALIKSNYLGIVSREDATRYWALRPWHGVTHQDVLGYSLALAGRKAASSSEGIGKVVNEILSVIHPQGSPLVLARDFLLEWGLTPPVITDSYWLDVVEASNRVEAYGATVREASSWRRWSFPLPEKGTDSRNWGERLAWTAMQMKWVTSAESVPITPITKPHDVIAFIDSHVGLFETCSTFPNLLAEYAPQLTIPGFGGELEPFIEAEFQKSPGEEWTLRRTDFADYPEQAAYSYFHAGIFGPEVSPYEDFPYGLVVKNG